MIKIPGRITGETLRMLRKKTATIGYPFAPLILDENYRGKIEYDSEKCNGCKLCMKDCPAGAITITNIGTPEEKKFQAVFELGRCIYCSQCVESCRKGCLKTTNNIELACLTKPELKDEM